MVKVNSILYMIIMSILWILNLFNGTGIGQTYQTTEKARVIILMVFIIMVIYECKSRHFWIDKKDFIVFGGMIFIIVIVSNVKGYGNMGFHYLYAFLLVYILSKIEVHFLAIRLTGIIYAIMGMGVLYIYDHGTIFSGWNGNSIGMIGLYSFLIFLISFYDVSDMKSKIIILSITAIYIRLIEPTDSRSSTIFAIFAALFALSILPRKFIIKTNRRYYWWLLIPLIIAIIAINISHSAYMVGLNLWSLENFQKPLFNGRDRLWENGFKILKENLFWGRGTFEGNWHNCIITILTSYGCIGGMFWVSSMQRILAKGRKWMKDVIVVGSIITFIMMYIQQSVELGLVEEKPNILPYIVLGIMLGRVKMLEKYDCIGDIEGKYDRDKYYNSNI